MKIALVMPDRVERCAETTYAENLWRALTTAPDQYNIERIDFIVLVPMGDSESRFINNHPSVFMRNPTSVHYLHMEGAAEFFATDNYDIVHFMVPGITLNDFQLDVDAGGLPNWWSNIVNSISCPVAVTVHELPSLAARYPHYLRLQPDLIFCYREDVYAYSGFDAIDNRAENVVHTQLPFSPVEEDKIDIRGMPIKPHVVLISRMYEDAMQDVFLTECVSRIGAGVRMYGSDTSKFFKDKVRPILSKVLPNNPHFQYRGEFTQSQLPAVLAWATLGLFMDPGCAETYGVLECCAAGVVPVAPRCSERKGFTPGVNFIPFEEIGHIPDICNTFNINWLKTITNIRKNNIKRVEEYDWYETADYYAQAYDMHRQV